MPESQEELACWVRLGRTCVAGELRFPARDSRVLRDHHEALEDEVIARMDDEIVQEAEDFRHGMALLSENDSD